MREFGKPVKDFSCHAAQFGFHSFMVKMPLTLWQKSERKLLENIFSQKNKDIKATAAVLGISRPRTLRKLKDYGLYKPLRRA